ncbi:MFS transporter [Arthrobacter sp. JSM 101049]|uniref:MFS transporter n=1 Tax=Arthrobacter sp. JSM 101049 TaxID=929097 RepID=UPI003565D8C3
MTGNHLPDAGPAARAAASRPSLRKAMTAAIIGTVIEWYDYGLYGAAAGLIIGPLFFPEAISSAASLAAFATFAVGFIIRPLGGVVIGHVGDRFGRKPAMLLSVILMGAATVCIGLLPTAVAIGAWAPLLLVAMRCLQGFGAGAELAGAMTLVAEYAPARRRGFYTSLVLATPPAGIVLATLSFFLFSRLPDNGFMAWGWRVPFLLSAALFFVAIYIRKNLDETPAYQNALESSQRAAQAKLPLVELFRSNTSGVVLGFLSITGHNALNYIMAAFALNFMTSPAVGVPASDALLAVTIGSVFGILGAPVGGWASDRFGASRVMAFGAAAGLLFAFPLFAALESGSTLRATIAIAVGYGCVIGATSGSQGAFLTNLFPTASRFSGVAVARELNGALVAGFSPLIALALITWANGASWAAAAYLSACCLVSLVAVLAARGRGNQAAVEPSGHGAAVASTASRDPKA